MSRDPIETPADLPDTELNPAPPARTFWTLTEEERAQFDELNIGEDVVEQFVEQLNSYGLNEERFHDEVELGLRNHVEATEARKRHEAEVKAQQHKAQVAAFAGMALQGILAGLFSRTDREAQERPFNATINTAASYGEALAQRLALPDTLH
jgi:hypothetical protein